MTPIDRIVFFGTPEFAVPSLDGLVGAGRRPVLVVTQPARPAGRGRRLLEPPVAVRARELGLDVAQPAKVRNEEFLAEIGKLAPDLAVVVAFGQIFPRALLDLPRLGCLNVHASLLPRWRGAAPIAAAIAAGDRETGIAVQRMEAGLDTGPVYASRRLTIGDDESAGELSRRLATSGAALLLEVVAALERGEAKAEPQDEASATYAPKLVGVRVLDLAGAATELVRQVRAFHPEPGTALAARGVRLKLIAAGVAEMTAAAPPGTVVGVRGDELLVATGDGVMALRRAQRPGGRPVSGRELASGLRLAVGDRLA
ncbi:MAG: methionyl-tRNA formyltransferase [Thermoanaerobaculia bacterium]|nr:methionyl-tRNA formyltransferase [Thermoanaerobaculia bacterium]